MSDETVQPEARDCGNCKHYTHEARAAHKNRCKRFPGADGTAGVCAILRTPEGRCGALDGWEAR